MTLGLLVGLGAHPTAFAQGAPPPDQSAAHPDEPDEADRARALELYEESRERYRLADYEGAVALLREAYATFPEPNLLYNLARAYSNLGDFEHAIEAYERFLEAAPDTDLREVIETRVANHRATLAARQAERAAEERAQREALEAARRQANPEPGVDPAPWVLTGTGAGLLVVGAVLGGLSLAARADAEADPSFRSASDASDRAVALAWSANAGFAVGGLVALVGVIWGIVDVASRSGAPDDEAEGEGVALILGPRGAGVAW